MSLSGRGEGDRGREERSKEGVVEGGGGERKGVDGKREGERERERERGEGGRMEARSDKKL